MNKDITRIIFSAIENVKDPLTNKNSIPQEIVNKIATSNNENEIKIVIDSSPQVGKLVLNAFKDELIKNIQNKLKIEKNIDIDFDFKKYEDKIKSSYGTSKIKKIVAVASGKGGVGKSTITFNIALEFMHQGLKVGILDADIFGPSIPKMFDVKKTELKVNKKKIIPIEKNKIKIISMGLLLDENQPSLFKGPMAISAIKQFLIDVDWGELDILIIDMPPGTGDVPLTISKTIEIDGVIITSTPHKIALIDVKKTITMFHTVNTQIIGIIENMSYYECNNCDEKKYIFGKDGAKKLAKSEKINFLGEIPINEKIQNHNTYINNANHISNEIKKICYKIIDFFSK